MRILVLIILLCLSSDALSKAFCALRDPVNQIHELYPESTSFRSYVQTIDKGIRRQVAQQLPPNQLHFGELGRHTLYVALLGQKPLGFIHVRSEQSEWGLVEIAWAINMDMTIKNFTVQRCRSRARSKIESDGFKAMFVGLGFEQLKNYLASDKLSASQALVDAAHGEAQLASVVLRCGLKTLLVTQLAWQRDIAELRMMAHAVKVFGVEAQVQQLSVSYSQDAMHKLQRELGNSNTGFNRDTVEGFKVVVNGQPVGGLVHAEVELETKVMPLVWAISSEGKIMAVDSERPGFHRLYAPAFAQTQGYALADVEHCANTAEIYALEALVAANSIMSR